MVIKMEQAISIQEVKQEKKFNLEKFVKYGLMVLGFGLFCVYLAQLYVGYDIDTYQKI